MPATVRNQLQTACPSCHVPMAQEWGPRLLAALGRHCVTACCVHLVSEVWGLGPGGQSPLGLTSSWHHLYADWVKPLHLGFGMVTPIMEEAQTALRVRGHRQQAPLSGLGGLPVHQDGPPGREGRFLLGAVLPLPLGHR